MSTYLDSCDRCLIPVTPAAGLSDGDSGLVCGYRCPNCRGVWTCSWMTVPGRVDPPSHTADAHVAAVLHEQAAINRSHKKPARDTPAA
ncbi:hypothetical protein ABZ958_03255 [Streptomyces sp. NPDC046237]|uniref:hypothetical protein n=1 Tax=Streptomyces sp. NPDC046237 TaxID=3154914 RepID=UPI00340AEA7D